MSKEELEQLIETYSASNAGLLQSITKFESVLNIYISNCEKKEMDEHNIDTLCQCGEVIRNVKALRKKVKE